jgi:hypothetical protein
VDSFTLRTGERKRNLSEFNKWDCTCMLKHHAIKTYHLLNDALSSLSHVASNDGESGEY